MPIRNVTFSNRRDRTLAARLELPEGAEPAATALLAHCFTCGKDLKGLARFSKTLTGHGFAVLRFDFTGLGESEGAFAEAGIGGDADDLEDAATFLAGELAAPVLLVGHSLGGLAALLVAERLPSLKAVATIGTPADAEHVLGLVKVDPSEVAEDGEIETTVAGRAFTLPARFFRELDRKSPLECLAEMKTPLLVAHAVTDEVVGVEHARRLFRSSKHAYTSFVSLGQADHLLSREADARFAGHAIGGWAAALLEASGDAAGTTPTQRLRATRSDQAIERAETGAGYATDALAGGFPLRLDEPAENGGTDSGPSPQQLLRTALAACTSITVRMYADRKGWPLDRISVEVSASSERKNGVVHTRFERRIELDGDLSEAQRSRAIEIAGRCPVHRTLEGEVTIVTTEA